MSHINWNWRSRFGCFLPGGVLPTFGHVIELGLLVVVAIQTSDLPSRRDITRILTMQEVKKDFVRETAADDATDEHEEFGSAPGLRRRSGRANR